MKYYLALGGFSGCFLAFSSALLAGGNVFHALRNGAAGCLAGAILLRFFYSALLSCARAAAGEKSNRGENVLHEARNAPSSNTNGSK